MPTVRAINPVVYIDPDKLRVAAYCRVSSDSEDQLNSFQVQVTHYTNLIEQNSDWIMADIYADEGLSGTRADTRPEFQRMLKDFQRGKIDRIMTKSISRFARNTKDCLENVRTLTQLGVSVCFQNENIDTALISGEMLLNLYASFAQEESLSISRNLRWSYQRRMQSGEFVTCKAPFGYDLVGKVLVTNKSEAVVVKRIFADYLSGKGLSKIAEELTASGIPTPYGNIKWNHISVGYILKNEKYIGDALVQKTYSTDMLPFCKVKNCGFKDQYYIQGTQMPIISKTEFDSANALLHRRKKSHTVSSMQFLSGKIRCGVCDSSVRYKYRDGDTVYWVCRGHDQNKTNCPAKQIPEPEIHEAFIRMVEKMRKNYRYILFPLLDNLTALADKNTTSDIRIVEINKKIETLNEQNLALRRLRSKGMLDSVFYKEQSNAIQSQISRLQKKRESYLCDEENDEILDQIRSVINAFESDITVITRFDEILFDRLVEKIIVTSQDVVTFRLWGGVELTEPIQRSVR